MRIAVLSRNAELYSTRRLLDAAYERGIRADVIDPTQCALSLATNDLGILFRGQPLEPYDAVIPRIGTSVTAYGTAVLRQFEMKGIYCLNNSQAILRARDKLSSLQRMAAAGIGVPQTAYGDKPSDIPRLIDAVGGAPLVVKLLEGTQGIGVVLAENQSAAESILEAFMGLNAPILVQRFVQEAKGTDIRCFVVGNKVVAAMKRQAKPGEFRSNLHRGGSAVQVRLSKIERATALAAVKAMGLVVAGVDILRSESGPVVLEVNSSPGLEGIESCCGVDVAGAIVDYLMQQLQETKKRSRS